MKHSRFKPTCYSKVGITHLNSEGQIERRKGCPKNTNLKEKPLKLHILLTMKRKLMTGIPPCSQFEVRGSKLGNGMIISFNIKEMVQKYKKAMKKGRKDKQKEAEKANITPEKLYPWIDFVFETPKGEISIRTAWRSYGYTFLQ